MASKESNGSDYTPDRNGNGAVVLDLVDEREAGGILQSYFVLLALRHRRLLMVAALCSLVGAYCLTAFVMNPKYEATAIIRPVGQNPNSLGGLLQSAGITQSVSGVGIDSDIGTNVHDPEELVAILNSYNFTVSMIQAENLGPHLSGGRSLSWLIPSLPFSHHEDAHDSPLWGYYLRMSSAFTCENSVRTGNITLNFLHKDPAFARHVLQLYIDRLRDYLRSHDVVYDKDAANSLEEAAASASDPMLRDDLYQLAAMQVQKTKTAEANADFAFSVIEEPYVPPVPSRPWVILDTLFATIAVPLFIFAGLVIRDWIPRLKQELAEAASESERIPESIALARKPRAPLPEDDRPYTY